MIEPTEKWGWKGGDLVSNSGRRIVSLEDNGSCGDPDCCGEVLYSLHVNPEERPRLAAVPQLIAALLRLRSCAEWATDPDVRRCLGYKTQEEALKSAMAQADEALAMCGKRP